MNESEQWWAENADNKKAEYYDGLYEQTPFIVNEPILEIGGGAGTFLKWLNVKSATIWDLAGDKNLVSKNYSFHKVDISKQLEQPYKLKKWKTIFIMETLEHLYNPLYLMAQVYDILDDSGICYISVPYTALNISKKNDLNIHHARWRADELQNQLEKIGFKVEFIRKRRRFKDLAFWLPHCFLVAKLTKN